MQNNVLRTPIPTTEVDGFSISSLRKLEYLSNSPKAQQHLEKVSIQIDIEYDGTNPNLGAADGWSCYCTRKISDTNFEVHCLVPVIIFSQSCTLTSITVEEATYEKHSGIWLRLDTFDQSDQKTGSTLNLIRPHKQTLH